MRTLAPFLAVFYPSSKCLPLRLAGLTLLLPLLAGATSVNVNIGLLSYDNLFPGTNVFTIQNLTGAAPCVTFCANSDFPIVTAEMFTNLTAEITVGASVTDAVLEAILAQSSVSPGVLEYDASTQIQEASLIGALSQSIVTLQDGTVLSIDSGLMTFLLPQVSNLYLQEGDLAVITVQGTVVPTVPEPAAGGLFLIGCVGIAISRWRIRRDYQ